MARKQIFLGRNLLAQVCVLLLLAACSPDSNDASILDTARRAQVAAADPGNYGRAVRITGVVTYCDSQWHLLFVQDSSGGFFVGLQDETVDLRVGQRVELSGRLAPSNRGIDNLQSRILGDAPLPIAKSLPDGDDTSAGRLSNWVEIQGMVRAAAVEDGRLTLTVLEGTRRIKVRILVSAQVRPINFVGTKLSLAGVSAAAVDKSGKPTGIQVLVSSLDQIRFPGGRKLTDPFSSNSPLTATLDRHAVGDLVHLSGIVIDQKPGRIVAIHHGPARIVVRLADDSQLAPGDSVDLLGFVSASSAFQVEDAIVRIIAPRMPLDESQITGALRTIRELKSLSAETAAKGLPVEVTGTVTYIDPSLSLLFVQDASGGVYVDIHNQSAEVEAGDLVRVTGRSGPGDYAPIITRPTITRLGRSAMPQPLTLSLQTLVAGNNDAGWVEIVGVVHAVSQLNNHHSFTLAVAGNRFDVQLPRSAEIDTIREGLLDAQVRIDAVSGAVFNEKRQLVGLKFFVPDVSHIQIIEPPPAEATRTVRSIVALLRFDPVNLSIHRTTVRGAVTLRDNERGFYVQDATAGIYVVAEPKTSVRIGQYVEVSGFAVAGPYGPYLEDAAVNVVEGASHVTPVKLTAEDLTTGLYNSQLITVQGRLLERVNGPDDETLILQVGALVLRARLRGEGALFRLRRESVLEVSGILEADGRSDRSDLRIALPSPRGVRVIAAAPWWTWENIAQILTAVIVAILAALLWLSAKVYRVRSYQAAYDALTGLPNRRATLEFLERHMARAMRERRPIGVILADVDHFKRINDTYGHQAGDAVLRKMADLFNLSLRSADTVGRYGGEEFLIVFPNCDRATAAEIAERIRACIAAEYFPGSHLNLEPFRVTCSFGIAVASGPKLNMDHVLAAADRALYAAKNSGRNRVATAEVAPEQPREQCGDAAQAYEKRRA